MSTPLDDGSARGTDPNMSDLLHHGIGRDLAQHPGLLDNALVNTTASRGRDLAEERYDDGPTSPVTYHDTSVQVREARPTAMIAGQLTVNPGVPIQVAYDRPERTSLILTNTGTVPVFIGNSQGTSTPSNGFPLTPGSALTLSNLDSVWVSVASGSAVIGFLDEYRTRTGL